MEAGHDQPSTGQRRDGVRQGVRRHWGAAGPGGGGDLTSGVDADHLDGAPVAVVGDIEHVPSGGARPEGQAVGGQLRQVWRAGAAGRGGRRAQLEHPRALAAAVDQIEAPAAAEVEAAGHQPARAGDLGDILGANRAADVAEAIMRRAGLGRARRRQRSRHQRPGDQWAIARSRR